MEKTIYTTKINTGRQFEFDVMKVFAIFFMVVSILLAQGIEKGKAYVRNKRTSEEGL